jgi:hypothetical protein
MNTQSKYEQHPFDPAEWVEHDIEADELTYLGSAAGVTITQERAVREVLDHGIDPQEFFDECGERETYPAQAVLVWLGY